MGGQQLNRAWCLPVSTRWATHIHGEAVPPGVLLKGWEHAGAQIRDNEFLQRENLLLEAYLAKVDPSKVGIVAEEETSKVGPCSHGRRTAHARQRSA